MCECGFIIYSVLLFRSTVTKLFDHQMDNEIILWFTMWLCSDTILDNSEVSFTFHTNFACNIPLRADYLLHYCLLLFQLFTPSNGFVKPYALQDDLRASLESERNIILLISIENSAMSHVLKIRVSKDVTQA